MKFSQTRLCFLVEGWFTTSSLCAVRFVHQHTSVHCRLRYWNVRKYQDEEKVWYAYETLLPRASYLAIYSSGTRRNVKIQFKPTPLAKEYAWGVSLYRRTILNTPLSKIDGFLIWIKKLFHRFDVPENNGKRATELRGIQMRWHIPKFFSIKVNTHKTKKKANKKKYYLKRLKYNCLAKW